MIKRRKGYQILLLILFLSFFSYAQKDYEEGYVVLNTKDTLYGFIKDRKEHPFGGLYKKIKFKDEKGKTKYKPNQILVYKKGESTFESMRISNSGKIISQNYIVTPEAGKFHFLKVVQKGFLTYYYWEFEDADSGYIDSVGYFKKEDNALLIRVSQGIFGLRKKSLAIFLGDYADLALKIKNKEIKNPREVVIDYNNWKKENQ